MTLENREPLSDRKEGIFDTPLSEVGKTPEKVFKKQYAKNQFSLRSSRAPRLSLEQFEVR